MVSMSQGPDNQHPSSVDMWKILKAVICTGDRTYMDTQYCNHCNAVEHHKHSAYCSKMLQNRKQKQKHDNGPDENDPIKDCHFNKKEDKEGNTKFTIKIVMSRNDAWLNSHDPDVLFVWQATTEGKNVQFVFCKSMVRLIGQRNKRQQEVCHLILSLPLVSCTHTFIQISLRNDTRKLIVELPSEEAAAEDGPHVVAKPTTKISLIDACYGIRLDPGGWLSAAEVFDIYEPGTWGNSSLIVMGLKLL
eukprot:scaffold306817_cov67-Attheya_sp.AAC.3